MLSLPSRLPASTELETPPPRELDAKPQTSTPTADSRAVHDDLAAQQLLAHAAQARAFLQDGLDAAHASMLVENPLFQQFLHQHYLEPLNAIADRLAAQTGRAPTEWMQRLIERGSQSWQRPDKQAALMLRLSTALNDALAELESSVTAQHDTRALRHRLSRLESHYETFQSRHDDGAAVTAMRGLQARGCWPAALPTPEHSEWPQVCQVAVQLYHHLTRRFANMLREHQTPEDVIRDEVNPMLYEAALLLSAAGIDSPIRIEQMLRQVARQDGRVSMLQGALSEAGYAAGLPIVLWGAARQAVHALSASGGGMGLPPAGGYLLGLVVGLTDSITARGAHEATRERRHLGSAPDRAPCGEQISREAGEAPFKQNLARGGLMLTKNLLLRALLNTAVIGCFPKGVALPVREALDYLDDAGAGIGAGAMAERTRWALRGGPDERAFRLLCQTNLAEIALRVQKSSGEPSDADSAGTQGGLQDFARGALHSLLYPSTWIRACVGVAPFVAIWQAAEHAMPRWGGAAAAGVAGSLATALANHTIGSDQAEVEHPEAAEDAEEEAMLAAENLARACVASLVMAGMVMWCDGVCDRAGEAVDRAALRFVKRLPPPPSLPTLLAGMAGALNRLAAAAPQLLPVASGPMSRPDGGDLALRLRARSSPA